MMKFFMKFIILTGLFLCLSGRIFAQVYVVYDGPNEINQSVSNTGAKIIILSHIQGLTIAHSAGSEKGVFVGQESGMYRYELNLAFSATDLKDGFCATSMTVESSNASKRGIRLILHPGKCYQMTCEEKPRTLFPENETSETEIYSYDNKALLLFISKITDLTIRVGENTVVKNGKKENVSGIDVNITKKEDSNTNYELVFHTDVEEFNSSPEIIIEDSSPEELTFRPFDPITAKGWYRIRINKSTQESQILNVSGSVSDKKGKQLIGISVTVKGGNTETVTDIDGKFNIDVSENSTLIFKHAGYKTEKFPVKNGQTKIDVEMETSPYKNYGRQIGIGITFPSLTFYDVNGLPSIIYGDNPAEQGFQNPVSKTGSVGLALQFPLAYNRWKKTKLLLNTDAVFSVYNYKDSISKKEITGERLRYYAIEVPVGYF